MEENSKEQGKVLHYLLVRLALWKIKYWELIGSNNALLTSIVDLNNLWGKQNRLHHFVFSVGD